MSMRLRFWLPGMALLVGGVVRGTCHLFHFASPTDLAHVAQYPQHGAVVHLALFIRLLHPDFPEAIDGLGQNNSLADGASQRIRALGLRFGVLRSAARTG